MSPSSDPAGTDPAGTDPAGTDPAGTDPAGTAGAGAEVVRTVVVPVDLHARPAGRLARAAAGFTAVTTVLAGDRYADARSVLAVMALGATAGTPVTIRATGPDATAAADTLATLLHTTD
jgi:phosphotransferase system HPr (HPr) family protein